ncbi:choice-of-anchor B family protein [Rubrivirga sp.]|uniref:choice-of-anchor B family protein n=1 Tax=Rubrivirga sp. TaxID=1885344 RepID=UPI003C76CFFF
MRALLVALALATAASAQPDLEWSWSPEPRWLDGADAGREYFEGGLDFGANFTFTTVRDADVAPVVVRFDPALESVARVFDYRDGLRDLGTGSFPGAAYDVSDPATPRRLNVGLVEDEDGARADRVWNPDGSPTGGFEWLIVFASDYDGDGSTYAGENGFELDAYYGFAGRVVDGRALLESPAELAITPAPLRAVRAAAVENGVVDLEWTAASYVGDADLEVVDAATSAQLALEDAEAGRVRLTGLDVRSRYDLEVRLLAGGGVRASRTVEVTPAVSLGVEAWSSLNPGRAGGSTYGDVWSYVAPDGTEYALLTGRGSGLSVIDVTAAPAQAPVEVGFVASPPGARDAKDVKVLGRYAYVAHEIGPVQIVDLEDPTAPLEVGVLDVQPGTTNGGSHNVLVAEGKLWVVGGRTRGDAGVRVYGLEDPAAPRFLGAFQPTHQPVVYYHDFEVRGDRAYGSAIYTGGGVDVLDVSDPSDIELVTTFTYPGAGAHNTCSTPDGNTVYVGDEIGSNGNWMRIFDVTDIQNAELVGEIVVDREAVVHNCYVVGDRLFVAHYTEGLRVFDVSEPHTPVEVAFLDTYLEPGYGTRGAWTATPPLPSGKILVSDLQSGLFVVTLEGGRGVSSQPEAMPASDLRAWPNPASTVLSVSFVLEDASAARLSVVDALGREVAILEDGTLGAGGHRSTVDLEGLPSGLYLVRLIENGGATSVPVTVAR